MALTFRDNKGDALSFSEMDSNFRHFTGSFTNTGTITAAAFAGDGSAITGVTAEWDGTHNGNAQITGSLTVTSNISSSGDITCDDLNLGPNARISSTSGVVTFSATDIDTDSNSIRTTNITASGNISMPTNASSINMVNGSIYSRNGGSYPGIQLNSGVNNNTIWFLAGNNDSIGGEVTASFVSSGFINNVGIIRARANSSLLLQGGPAPNDANDGVKIETADASNVYQPRFQIESDTTNVDAYFTNINGLGINDSTPTATLDVNGNINTTSNITASGNISASGNLSGTGLTTSGSRVKTFRQISVGSMSTTPTDELFLTDELILITNNNSSAGAVDEGNLAITSWLNNSDLGAMVELSVFQGTGTVPVILRHESMNQLNINGTDASNNTFTLTNMDGANDVGSFVRILKVGNSSASIWGTGIYV